MMITEQTKINNQLNQPTRQQGILPPFISHLLTHSTHEAAGAFP